MENRINEKLKNDRLNEIKYNSQGLLMKILQYNSSHDIIVIFEDGSTKHTDYKRFHEGKVKSNFYPNVYNIGYIGNTIIYDKNGKLKKSYDTWHQMLRRCYDNKYKAQNQTYKDCIVCDEWLCYANFEKWYNINYYNNTELDKDILFKNNKIYSPKNCIFVPKRINSLFTKSTKSRGQLPIGVSYYPRYNKYTANCSIIKENGIKGQKKLGYFKTIEEAFDAYKNFKEIYIKQIANEYKNYIPIKLYNALLNYKVEITD